MKNIIYIVLLLSLHPPWSFAFDNEKTHKQLTAEAFENSQLTNNVSLLEQLGFQNTTGALYSRNKYYTLTELLQEGSEEEDKPSCRAANHFHNPLKPWTESELTDPIWLVDRWCDATTPFRDKYSNISWATGLQDKDGTPMSTEINGTFAPPEENGRNWLVARDHYYKALTASNDQEKEQEFAETFRTVGYVLHLLQDMAVPAHTRNDFSQGHSQNIDCPNGKLSCGKEWIGNPFEGYVRDNWDNIDAEISEISTPYTGERILTSFWDTDTVLGSNSDTPQIGFDIGLAEYTNANFVSHATMFKPETNTEHYFPYPNRDSIADQDYPDQLNEQVYEVIKRDGKLDKGVYITKNRHGEIIQKFLKPRYALYGADWDTEERYDLKFTLDHECFLEYASKLIPRAVGYSADLLDYFFRGKIDIQEPLLTIGSDSSITGISCSIKNTTPPIDADQVVEPFASGNIELVYSYTTTITDPGTVNPVEEKHFGNVGNIYPGTGLSITGSEDPINSNYVDVNADLSGSPIPSGAYDISFTLVFKGTLGHEGSAVAAQMYSFENSRIAYFHQSGGQPNTSNVITISPDGSFPLQMTNATAPNPWFFSPTWSKDGTKMAFEDHSCIEVDNDGFCPMDDYVRDIVIVDLLSEEAYPGNVLSSINNNGDPVANPSFSPDGNEIVALAMNTDNPIVQFSNIVRLDIQNGTATQLTQYDPEVTDLLGSTPAWSPKGDEIAYHIYRVFNDASRSWDIKNDIMTISTEGGVSRALTNDQYINIQPSWSPDGAWIAFSSDRDGESSMDIWLMDKDGNNLTQLVDCTPASCYRPTFSPDGRFVAFSNGSEIYTVNVYGELQHITEIASLGLETGGLVWSPYLVPPSLIVEAEPRIIVAGSPSVLSWQSTRATEVSVSGVAEKQPANGNVVVYPDTTTTYTLTAAGPTGVKETSITITVQ